MRKLLIAVGLSCLLLLSACSLSASQPPELQPATETPVQPSVKAPTPTQEVIENLPGVPTVTSESPPEPEQPTVPPEPTPTEEVVLEPTPTPTQTTQPGPIPVDVRTNDIDQARIVFIPAGEFTMGSDAESDPNFWGAEGPRHVVYLDDYWIYEKEVTVGMYETCIASGYCPAAFLQLSENPEILQYRSDPQLPMVFVTWEAADYYCSWAADGLPTEAQWEKAARGIDERLFPWGNKPFQQGYANYCGFECDDSSSELATFDDGYPLTAPVGTFPAGASPYGVMDMAGNVWEWTADFFYPTYYAMSPFENPTGPASGDRHVVRGGGFTNGLSGMRTVARISLDLEAALNTVGFRCVLNTQ
jgi:eukaryotic-like serine/threonine-protein kinase